MHLQNMFIIYVTDLSPKNKMQWWRLNFLQKSKLQMVGNKKKFYYFISEIPNFFYMGFFRKFSMFHWSIPLKSLLSSSSLIIKSLILHNIALITTSVNCQHSVPDIYSQTIYTIVRLPHPRSRDSQGQETFLEAFTATLRSKGLSRSKMKWWDIYKNLPVNATVRIPHPRNRDNQVQETLAPSAVNQTCNYDKACSNHPPSLSTLRLKGLSCSNIKWWAIYTNCHSRTTPSSEQR